MLPHLHIFKRQFRYRGRWLSLSACLEKLGTCILSLGHRCGSTSPIVPVVGIPQGSPICHPNILSGLQANVRHSREKNGILKDAVWAVLWLPHTSACEYTFKTNKQARRGGACL